MPARPFDKACTPQPSRFGAATQMDKGWTPPTLHDLERPPKWTRVGPPNPSRLGAASQMDKGLTPPTLHDLERPPKWTRAGPPQPFTTWRAFLSRKLTADFLLPNSAYKMCHLHWAVGRSPGSPYFELHGGSQMDKGWTPPTLHDLERLPNGQGFEPPQPFTTWSGSQMDKGLTPPTLHDLERLRKWTRV